MILRQRQNVFRPANFQLAAAGVLGTAQKFTIDSTWPIEEIVLLVNITAGAAGFTNNSNNPDGILGIIRNINLSANDGNQARSIVDYSGPGILEYDSLAGLNLSPETWESVRLSQGATVGNNQQLQIAYRIPLVHPMIDEPLRTRMMLPVHTFPQDPVLTVTFETSATLISAGAIAGVSVDVILIRRTMSPAATGGIQNSGGFVPFDLIETPYSIGVGVSGTQRFSLPTPGSYLNLLFRQYLGSGGTLLLRTPLDQITTFGSESLWRIESGGVAEREWTWKGLKEINAWSRTHTSLHTQTSAVATATFAAPTTAGSPTVQFNPSVNFGRGIVATTSFQAPASCLQDYLTDGLQGANELGSVLDCNTPVKTGLKMEVVGNVSAAAGVASTLFIGGHRLFGDLSRWQSIR